MVNPKPSATNHATGMHRDAPADRDIVAGHVGVQQATVADRDVAANGDMRSGIDAAATLIREPSPMTAGMNAWGRSTVAVNGARERRPRRSGADHRPLVGVGGNREGSDQASGAGRLLGPALRLLMKERSSGPADPSGANSRNFDFLNALETPLRANSAIILRRGIAFYDNSCPTAPPPVS